MYISNIIYYVRHVDVSVWRKKKNLIYFYIIPLRFRLWRAQFVRTWLISNHKVTFYVLSWASALCPFIVFLPEKFFFFPGSSDGGLPLTLFSFLSPGDLSPIVVPLQLSHRLHYASRIFETDIFLRLTRAMQILQSPLLPLTILRIFKHSF